jgi:hypothetical protein
MMAGDQAVSPEDAMVETKAFKGFAGILLIAISRPEKLSSVKPSYRPASSRRAKIPNPMSDCFIQILRRMFA